MSTKVYWAYQVPYGQYPTFVEEVREHVHSAATDRLVELLQCADLDEQRDLFDTYYGNADEGKKDVDFSMHEISMMLPRFDIDPEEPSDVTCFMFSALTHVRQATTRTKRDPVFDLESRLIANDYEEDYYVQHQGESFLVSDFESDVGSDAKYFNNTDPPEEHRVYEGDDYVDWSDEWERRGDVWSAIGDRTTKSSHFATETPLLVFHPEQGYAGDTKHWRSARELFDRVCERVQHSDSLEYSTPEPADN